MFKKRFMFYRLIFYDVYLELYAAIEQINITLFFFFLGLVVCSGDGTRAYLKSDQFVIILKND
jgi:hypothetical protein